MIRAQRGGTAAFVQADVTQSASVKDYVEKTLSAYGRIDAFFNNAGIEGKVIPTQDYDEEIFDRVIAVNLKGVFLGMRHVLPVMLKQGSGAIVNTASVSGLGGDWHMSAYNASKGAVVNLTRAMAMDYAKDGVRVNSVCPSLTLSKLTQEDVKKPSTKKKLEERMPLGRIAMPDDIAAVIAFLASDDARFVTGVNLPVDGGVSASNGQPSW